MREETIYVPPGAPPRCRSTRPGCENALPDAERCWSRSQRGGAPTRAKLGTSSTSSMSGLDQTTKRQPALAPCPTGKKNGSSHFTGKRCFYLEEEVVVIP